MCCSSRYPQTGSTISLHHCMAPMASGKALCKYFNTRTHSEDGLKSANVYGPKADFCVCDDETPGSAKRRNSSSSRIPQYIITIPAEKFQLMH